MCGLEIICCHSRADSYCTARNHGLDFLRQRSSHVAHFISVILSNLSGSPPPQYQGAPPKTRPYLTPPWTCRLTLLKSISPSNWTQNTSIIPHLFLLYLWPNSTQSNPLLLCECSLHISTAIIQSLKIIFGVLLFSLCCGAHCATFADS